MTRICSILGTMEHCTSYTKSLSSKLFNMDRLKELFKISDDRIDELSKDLHEISLKIWNKPELKYEEIYAHELLTETLKKHGFDVTPKFTLETAFRAVYEQDSNGSGKGLTAGIICEYDALPVIGHACGHNLIAEAGIAAGLGSLKCFNNYPQVKLTE